MFSTRQPSIAALRDAPIKFRYGNKRRVVLVDAMTASAILACYDGLSEQANRDKMERMVSGSPEQFCRVIDFAWRHVRIGGKP